MKLLPKRCPKCLHGKMFPEEFDRELVWACVNCGYRVAVVPVGG